MTNEDRIAKLQDRALTAEDLAERRGRMVEWLAGELARRVGTAVRDDGELVCFDLPPDVREGLCSRGPAGCAECWADAAEVAVTPIEHYLLPEYQGRALFNESAQEFLDRKRREAGDGPARARVIRFSAGQAGRGC